MRGGDVVVVVLLLLPLLPLLLLLLPPPPPLLLVLVLVLVLVLRRRWSCHGRLAVGVGCVGGGGVSFSQHSARPLPFLHSLSQHVFISSYVIRHLKCQACLILMKIDRQRHVYERRGAH